MLTRVTQPFKIFLITMMVSYAAGVLPSVTQAQAATARDLPDFADLVERVGPAVVNIRTTEKLSQSQMQGQMPFPDLDENDPFFEFFKRFMPPRQQQQPVPRGRGNGGSDDAPRGVGSGFIIDASGFVLTNFHVVEGADDIIVTLSDKREFKAKVIGSDKRSDIALVKVEAAGLPSLAIGDPSKTRVGEWVVAIGSPFGLDNTVTAGIVSAKARDTGDYLPFIQTDVAVNPGNSGGPLINMRGEVIGINSQIYSRTGGFMGISFAIPIDEAIRVADQLKNSGRVTRGRIGVSISEVTKEVAEALGLQKTKGALIRLVEPASPAEKAGLEAGDIVLKLDGKVIDRSSDLPRMVGNMKPGLKTTIEIWRKGAAKELPITIVQMEAEKLPVAKVEGSAKSQTNALGLVVSDLTEARKRALKLTGSGGVLVEIAESAGFSGDLRRGDIVLRLGNTDIMSARQFDELAAKLKPGQAVALLIYRNGNYGYVTVRPNAK
jgi:serine protease Do